MSMIPGLDRFAFGGDYNPDGWPATILAEDLQLMRTAGVNLVTLGVFSWFALEPRPHQYDFSGMDATIERLASAGVGVCLATPTAGPPQWFWRAHPQARVVNREGHTLGTSARGMGCPSSPAYRAAAEAIATALAERYGRHPAVKLWHVHNEYGVPVFDCYCETSAAAFRQWLQRRYGSLAALNAAWGTTFWGQGYSEWDEIQVPAQAATAANPTQQLDFQRFSSDEQLACYRLERDAIRRHSDRPVTTNLMVANAHTPDYWAWAPELDLIANDHYLTAERTDSHIDLALSADLSRSYAGGRPWILMEHSTSAVNWQPRNLAKRPGELLRNSLQHLARGADAVMFFQFRSLPFGAEKFHSAMVPPAGSDTRVFREVCELGQTLTALEPVRGSVAIADVAILWDPQSFWAQDLEWRPSVDLDHRREIEAWYRILWDRGITVDFAHPEADLGRYPVVLAPASYLLSDAASGNLGRYVDGGGTLLVGYFSGIVNEHEQLPAGPMPGQLRDVLGLEVEEFLPLRSAESVRLHSGATGTVWSESIRLRGASVLDAFTDGPGAGGPALTRHAVGGGSAWYLATTLSGEGLAEVLESVLSAAGVLPNPQAGGDLEHVRRLREGEVFEFWINHSDADRTVRADGTDLITGARVEGEMVVPAGRVRVVRSADPGR